jgi:hypothetical protein
MIKLLHLGARVSRPVPAGPGASPALTPSRPDAVLLRSDRCPGLALRKGLPDEHPAIPAQSRVPLRRKRPAGTRGSGDIDKPSAATGRARSIGNRAASEIDAPGPRLTPTCGGRTRRPRTEEWPLPDDHPRRACQLGALDPRSPITKEGLTTVPVPPPIHLWATLSLCADRSAKAQELRRFQLSAVHLRMRVHAHNASLTASFLRGFSIRAIENALSSGLSPSGIG